VNKSTRTAILLAAVLGPLTSGAWIAMHWREILDVPEIVEAGPGKPAIAKPKAREWSFQSDEIEKLAKDLRDERTELETRRKDLDATEKRIAAEKEELTRLKGEIEQMRDDIGRSVPVLQTSETANVKSLAKVYAAMKPAEAVAVLAGLEDSSIVKMLGTMKADQVGNLFAEMARTTGPDGPMAPRAAKLSEQLRLLQKEPAQPAN
jgi:flagellar motility protein MotE (MotC chaperone)